MKHYAALKRELSGRHLPYGALRTHIARTPPRRKKRAKSPIASNALGRRQTVSIPATKSTSFATNLRTHTPSPVPPPGRSPA